MVTSLSLASLFDCVKFPIVPLCSHFYYSSIALVQVNSIKIFASYELQMGVAKGQYYMEKPLLIHSWPTLAEL